MNTRNLLHFGLLIPAIAGLFLIVGEFSKATSKSLTDASFSKSNAQAWSKIVEVMPVEMPQEWPENETEDLTKSAELSPEQRIQFDENNSFIVGCSFLVLLGIIGVALVGAAKTLDEPVWNPLIRTAAIIGVTFLAFYLWGFNLTYPGEFESLLPNFQLGPPALTNPVEYGLEGMNEFTDLFYLSAYAAFFGALVISQTAGRQTALSAFIPAIPMVVFTLPLVVSWKWGGGWLDASFMTYDFAGAALFHWHAGAVALATGIALKLFRRRPEEGRAERAPTRLGWWIPGIALYFLVMIGMNAGSVLSATPGVVASCFQSTIYAAITSAILAGIWGIFLKSRSFYEWIGHGLIAGAVVVSGVCDSLTGAESVVLGIIAGGLIPPVIFLLDRFLSIDPLAVAGVHGLAGLIGTLAAVPFGEDISMIGQFVLILTVPLMSLAFVVVSAIIFGFLKLLLHHNAPANIDPPYDDPPSGNDPDYSDPPQSKSPVPYGEPRKTPPPLPRR